MIPGDSAALDSTAKPGTAGEVLRAFTLLGLTSFGGPVAHLGYFRQAFVVRRRWLDEAAYADLVALCQFLPGPASSQTGFAIGLMRAGLPGALAAWVGFTLPSALLLAGFATIAGQMGATGWGAGLLHGLKLTAVAIIAQAVWGMARSLCPDRPRASIGILAALLALLAPASLGQIGAIAFGALAGLVVCRGGADIPAAPMHLPWSRRAGALCLAGFALLLAASFMPQLAAGLVAQGLTLFAAFFRAGALVFGGGHVVLPLLRAIVVARGWVSEAGFLAGYGAAQAVPGPLFTFAAYLGAVARIGPGGFLGAGLALVGIFLPGLLLLLGTLPFWHALRAAPAAQAAVRGVNAAVVGVLGAAFYNPVWTGSVGGPADVAVALAGFAALTIWRVPPVAVVAGCALAGLGLAVL